MVVSDHRQTNPESLAIDVVMHVQGDADIEY
jgi:hypothetical protein